MKLAASETDTDRQKQGDKGCRHRLAEDCSIDLFLTHIVILYSGPYDPASLMEGFQPGFTRAVCTPWVLGSHSLYLLTDWLMWVPVYIWFHNAYTFWLSAYMTCFWLSTHVSCPLIYTVGISCFRNPWLAALLKVNIQHNNSNKHQSFVYAQLNDQTVPFITTWLNTSHLFALSLNVKQFYLTNW